MTKSGFLPAKTCIFACGVVLGVAMAEPCRASGFYLQEQSAAAMGSAFAGSAAMPHDASVIYYNPAAMTGLEAVPQVEVNLDVLSAKSDMIDQGSTFGIAPVGGVDSDNAIPDTVIGNAYAAYPFADGRVWAGVGVSTPFGLSTKYNSNWFGRYDSTESELVTIDVQPSVAYKVADWLSVGAGLDVQYADAELVSTVSNGVTEGRSKLTGSDWSLGYNAGMLIRPGRDTRVGVHYRSRVYHELDGRIQVTGVAGLNEDVGGRADLNLPEIVSGGIAHDLTDRLTLLGQVSWTGWDSLDKITAIRDDGSIADSVIYEWQPTWNYAVGAQYRVNDAVTLRGGYQYDTTPTTDELRATRIPDGDRHNFAAGVGYDVNEDLALNLSGLYGIMEDETVDVTRNGGFARVRAEREDSDYKFISLGVSYKFR